MVIPENFIREIECLFRFCSHLLKNKTCSKNTTIIIHGGNLPGFNNQVEIGQTFYDDFQG